MYKTISFSLPFTVSADGKQKKKKIFLKKSILKSIKSAIKRLKWVSKGHLIHSPSPKQD